MSDGSLPPAPQTSWQTWETEWLVPAAWRKEEGIDGWYVYNPTLAWVENHYVMLYRVVRSSRLRIAACRLDAQLHLIPDSVVPFSDTINGVKESIGDPRVFFFHGRLFASYSHYPLPSTLHLVEMDVAQLRAATAARPLLFEHRQRKERNWTCFQYAADLYAIYSISPHVVLRLDLSQPHVITCEQVYRVTWDAERFIRKYGPMRGGAAPILTGDAYSVFFHSTQSAVAPLRYYRTARQWLQSHLPRRIPDKQAKTGLAGHDAISQLSTHPSFWEKVRAQLTARTYIGGFYRFAARPPFEPLDFVPQPILAPTKGEARSKQVGLIPKNWHVVYPGGASPTRDGRWVVAYGLNDERCCARVLDQTEIMGSSVTARMISDE